MPEMKNLFRSGIMNKDDDERIVPNGQYRDAMNIEVATSEGSEIGTVQNTLGNKRVDQLQLLSTGDFTCIGAVSDEKNDVLYWFVTSNGVDAIIEYHDNNTTTPILVDFNKNVLKFDKNNIITGINIIDNLLFWTDNVNEPKKINIDNFKLNNHTNLLTHSDMFVNEVSVGEVVEDHITVIRKRPNRAPKIVLGDTVVKNTYDFGDIPTTGGSGTAAIDITTASGQLPISGLDQLTFTHEGYENHFMPFEFEVDDIILLSRQNAVGSLPQNYEIKLKIVANPGSDVDIWYPNASPTPWGRFRFTADIVEIASSIPINQSFIYNAQKLTEEDVIFEREFVRFATRYKYEDGEYSAFSPFTQPVFLAGSYGFHPTKDSHNVGMSNKIINLKLLDLISDDTPEDVVQLDILFKKDSSTTVYSIDSIRPNETVALGQTNSWNKSTDTIVLDSSYVPGDITTNHHKTFVSGNTGEYNIITENIYAALPANQMLRPWDNVPRKALSQEITANRLIYGNYLQNYNLIDHLKKECYTDMTLDLETRSFAENDIIDFITGKKSVKSERTYYLGIVYGDKYGRETPVFTGKDSSIKIPFDLSAGVDFVGAASSSLRLQAKLKGSQPEWAHYYKYFIKQTTGEYYNLTVDRVYKSIQDQSLWLSLPSSDRNKLQEGDYFTMKKQSDLPLQVPVKNKIKVIDIKNEAPESIKFDYSTLGTGGGSSGNLANLFADSNGQPAENVVRISIDKETWIETEFGANLDENTPTTRYALQFSILSGNVRTLSDMYFISTAYQEEAGIDGRYTFILIKKITAADSWVESSPGVLNSTLSMELFSIEEKNAVEFEGRFFVKIASNPITQTYLVPGINDSADFILTARAFAFWLADTPRTGDITTVPNVFGVYNASGGSGVGGGWSNNSGLATTDDEDEWATLLKYNTTAESSSGWFIDNMFFAANQGPFEDSTGGMWDVFYSGKMHKGNPLIANQFVNGLEGIVEVDINSGPYNYSNGLPNGSKSWSKYPYKTNDALQDVPNPSPPPVTVDPGYTPLNTTYGVPNPGGSHYTDTYTPTGPYEATNPGKGIFMHLSFSSVGVDLHDGIFTGLDTNASNTDIPGFKENLQWIASSGIHFHGNADSYVGHNFTQFNAGVTAVGLEAHDRQFDPSYMGGPSAASVVNSIEIGNQFKFEGDDITVYTIQSVDVKYLYNHTTWNPRIQMDAGGVATYPANLPGNSVSEALDSYRDTLAAGNLATLKNRIIDFGKANNRRVCYIIQLDKDPRTQAYNPLTTADKDTFNAINFIDTYVQPGSNTIPTSPAILETEAKEDLDLNIYYEASDALPRILDLTDGSGSTGLTSSWAIGVFGTKVDPKSTRGHMLAPIGTRVTVNNVIGTEGEIDYSPQNIQFPNQDFYLKVGGWDGNILILEGPGLESVNSNLQDTNDYYGQDTFSNGHTLTFWREDGSYTKAAIWKVLQLDSVTGDYATILEIKPDVYTKETGLAYYNCFSFGNGVESNRIRDDFNTSFIRHGVKASTVLEEPYEEERRKYGLIYSGLYNSTSGVNNLNQFIQAEKITKDINPVYGSIQKLYARDKDLITLCEDKILQIFVDRDVLFNADGNQQLLSTNNVLGSTQPFRGTYGISKNPESFAAESFRAYFTDKQRGAVLRLSVDGLTPISDAGMSDFFRDNLKDGGILYGSYDAYKKDYNLTINYGSETDLVLNPEFKEGFTTQTLTINERLINTFFNDFSGITGSIVAQDSENWVFGTQQQFYTTYIDLIDSTGVTQGMSVTTITGSDTTGSLNSMTLYSIVIPTNTVTVVNINPGGGASGTDRISLSSTLAGVNGTTTLGAVSGQPVTFEQPSTIIVDDWTYSDYSLNTISPNSIGTITLEDNSGGNGTYLFQTLDNGFTIEQNKKYDVEYHVSAFTGAKPELFWFGVGTFTPIQGTGYAVETITSPVNVNIGQGVLFGCANGSITLDSISIEEQQNFGGDVLHWDLNGGVDINNIYTYQTPFGDEKIAFKDAPSGTFLHQDIVNTNNVLDFKGPTSENPSGSLCRVSFNLSFLITGELTFRLFNNDGDGFKHVAVPGLNQFTAYIGDSQSNQNNGKFGFYVSSATEFTGKIDNVDIIIDGENQGRTVTFSEKAKGWTSFKSFVPEFAISCVNQYYTMNFGQLWKHYTNQSRNTFYNDFTDSSVTPILNMQPEVVKHFNTLNYEGTQSKVDEFTIKSIDDSGNQIAPITDKQYYNLKAKPGWYVEDIHTDKQEGSLNEFIEKEGKWFNYIKGKRNQIDPAAFNFQGIGTVLTVVPDPTPGCINPNATNYNPLATVDDGSCTGFAFELQLRDMTSIGANNGAARVVYTGTNIEATGLTYEFLNPSTGLMQTTSSYAWSNGGTTSEVTGLGMAPISFTVTDGTLATYVDSGFVAANIVNGCTDPNATNFNYSANTDDGTCII